MPFEWWLSYQEKMLHPLQSCKDIKGKTQKVNDGLFQSRMILRFIESCKIWITLNTSFTKRRLNSSLFLTKDIEAMKIERMPNLKKREAKSENQLQMPFNCSILENREQENSCHLAF